MLYEARSDEAEALVECENYLYETLKKRKTDDVQIECKKDVYKRQIFPVISGRLWHCAFPRRQRN